MKQRSLRAMRAPRSGQEGVMLLEALIGILIFSLGIMALVAMQSVSVSNVSNARYRVEAAFLANEILSTAWVDRGANSANVDNYAYPGGSAPSLTTWINKVNALMPQSGTYPPTVAVTPLPNVASGRTVTVTVRWRAPDALAPSNHIAIGYISDP
jgi:type IV pilus assembly protein PilV